MRRAFYEERNINYFNVMDFAARVLVYDIKYVIVAVILIGIYLRLDDYKTTKLRIIDILAIIIMLVLSGARYNVGTDYQTYLSRYQHYMLNWADISKRLVQDRLFITLCHLFSCFTQSPYGIFWMCAILLYPLLVFVARKITGRPSRVIGCYVFLGLFASSNNILRQALAVELVMFSYIAWQRDKRIISVVLALLSIEFHTTAIVALACCIISKRIKVSFRSLGISIVGGIIFICIWKYLTWIFVKISFFSDYAGYVNKQGADAVRLGMIGYIIFFAFITFELINYSRYIKNMSIERYNMISLLILSIPLLFIATQVSYANRFAIYLYQFAIFLVPDLFLILSKKKKYGMGLLIVLIVFLFYANIFSFDNTFWQYRFIWEQG